MDHYWWQQDAAALWVREQNPDDDYLAPAEPRPAALPAGDMDRPVIRGSDSRDHDWRSGVSLPVPTKAGRPRRYPMTWLKEDCPEAVERRPGLRPVQTAETKMLASRPYRSQAGAEEERLVEWDSSLV